jgi:REP element-mobilizing transposase RayT
LEHVKSGHGRFYELAAATVMPDHVHLIFKPHGDVDPSRIMKGIKGVSARLVNQHRNTTGRVWQEESWDRIIRDVAEFDEKLQYMYNNPVKAGLAADGDEYDGWHFNPDFV